MFLQLLKKKSQELNFTKIRGSKCRGNLNSRTAAKEEIEKNLAIYYRKSKKKEKKRENKCRRWKVQNSGVVSLYRKK